MQKQKILESRIEVKESINKKLELT